ncbi:ribosomal RNA processing protein 36 homolog isoform X2 [Mya arenaria]|uniref:ribosomal RNA processing protein 36 homolog isoform X2 n=1 Tax=Mya arenaria TaxID=6604 RepID=UPI0022E05DF5|nr:ribosomal RNA processing protein 36 homolog isoform X2 [Mya arenaria]
MAIKSQKGKNLVKIKTCTCFRNHPMKKVVLHQLRVRKKIQIQNLHLQMSNQRISNWLLSKKELSEMPLEDLIKIKEKLGLKAFNKIMFGDKFENKRKVFKRDNKNRPMEISAKRKVPLLRHHDVPKEKVRRDPRFDDLSGEFKDEHFQRNFSFLSDVKAREKQLVQKKLQKTTNEKKKEDLSKLLNKMTQSEQKEEREKKQADLEKSWKSKEKELVKEGKTPYFLKKGDRKKLELAERYRDLQKTGKLDQYLSKKHKRNAQKDRRKLPNRHDRYT